PYTTYVRAPHPRRTSPAETSTLSLHDALPIFLTYIALIYGLSVLVAKIVEYQYSAVASDSIPDPDELTSFFGFWYSNFNVLSLLDRKSTRLNSSHVKNSYAVFCLKKKQHTPGR